MGDGGSVVVELEFGFGRLCVYLCWVVGGVLFFVDVFLWFVWGEFVLGIGERLDFVRCCDGVDRWSFGLWLWFEFLCVGEDVWVLYVGGVEVDDVCWVCEGGV